MDVAVAHGLQKITRAKQAQDATRPKLAVENAMHPIQPWVVAAFYLFNPFTILSCVSRSTILFTNLSVVAALVCVLHSKMCTLVGLRKNSPSMSFFSLDRTSMAMFWAALAAYLSFYPVMLVPPLIMLTCRGETVRFSKRGKEFGVSLTDAVEKKEKDHFCGEPVSWLYCCLPGTISSFGWILGLCRCHLWCNVGTPCVSVRTQNGC